MQVYKWNEQLSVGIDVLDQQHQQLFELINKFYENILKKSSKEYMLEVISDLENYIIEHFTTEEKLMFKAGYEGILDHLDEHKEFINTVRDFRIRFNEDRLLLTLEVTKFIRDWITSHIKKTDMAYKDKLSELKLTPSSFSIK